MKSQGRPRTGLRKMASVPALGEFLRQIPENIIFDKEQLYIEGSRLKE
jgi:chromosome segregation ATPase